jgi:hypothetical protein
MTRIMEKTSKDQTITETDFEPSVAD